MTDKTENNTDTDAETSADTTTEGKTDRSADKGAEGSGGAADTTAASVSSTAGNGTRTIAAAGQSAPPPIALAVRPALWAGLAIATIAGAGTVFWASFAPVVDGAVIRGEIVSAAEREAVIQPGGGTLQEVLIADGDRVAAGDVLLRFDNRAAAQSYRLLRTQFDTALARKAVLEAEFAGAEAITFPDRLTARAHHPTVAPILAMQADVFKRRRVMAENRVAVLEQRILANTRQAERLEVELAEARQQLGLLEQSTLKDRNADNTLEAGGEAGGRQGTGKPPDTLVQELTRLRKDIQDREADLLELAVQSGEAEIEKLEVVKLGRETLVAELSDVHETILSLSERLEAARLKLAEAEVRAPQAGVIAKLNGLAAGRVVAGGTVLLEIVPSQERLVVRATVGLADRAQIVQGGPAEIRFPGLDTGDETPFAGEVREISSGALTDPRSGLPYFDARVVVLPEDLPRLARLSLTPGEQAEVLVQGPARTVFEAYLAPLFRTARRS
ncbi:MAG: HlyD family efflux transporter periplasmic adaptor subunit [Pseudomonadota bacterium]